MAGRVRPGFIYGRPTRGDAIEAYYGYLESRDEGLRGVPEGPGGQSAPVGFPVSDGASRRLRLSVIRVPDFVRIARHFEDIPLTGASADQRARRLAALAEHLDPTPVEIMDIHIPPRRPAGRLGQEPPVGGWCLVTVGDAARMDGRLPVLIGDPDEDGDDRLRSLVLLREVTEGEFAALRRVFSLAHIGDLGEEDDRGGAPEFGPRPPIWQPGGEGPSPAEQQSVRIICVAADGEVEPAQTAEAAPVSDYSAWVARAEEEQPLQHIHLTQG